MGGVHLAERSSHEPTGWNAVVVPIRPFEFVTGAVFEHVTLAATGSATVAATAAAWAAR